MFNNTKPTQTKNGESNSGTINIIGNGTSIEGEVRSNGDIRIDGIIKGSITSKARVVIGTTGIVEGDVNCQNADISGSIKGKTTVSELLFLKATAKVNGDIITGKLVVEVGASFTGACNMGPVIKDIKHGEKAPENTQLAEKTA